MSPATRYQYSRRIFTVAQRDTEYIEARGHRPIVTPREPIRIMMLREKKDRKKEDIFIRRASSGKNAAAAMKRLPKARVRGGKRKREKRRRQKYQTRSSHTRRRAVPILNAVEMSVPWLEIKLSFPCWGFSDRKSLGNDNFGREWNGKIGEFGVVWRSVELMDRQRQFDTIDSYFLAEHIHVQLVWH